MYCLEYCCCMKHAAQAILRLQDRCEEAVGRRWFVADELARTESNTTGWCEMAHVLQT